MARPPESTTDGFTDTPIIPGTTWHIHDPNRPQPPVVTPGPSPTLGMAPPSDAELLFDGKDLSKWQRDNGADANWVMTNGYMESIPVSGSSRRHPHARQVGGFSVARGMG